LMLLSIICLSINVSSRNIEEEQLISVEIRGKIQNPGVYELPLGSTIEDLFNIAIPEKDANTDVFSYQSELYNRQIIIVEEKSARKLISINSASIEELSSLPGIGISTAEKIIEYRNSVGSFEKLEDLMKVKGIGNGKFNKLKDYICL